MGTLRTASFDLAAEGRRGTVTDGVGEREGRGNLEERESVGLHAAEMSERMGNGNTDHDLLDKGSSWSQEVYQIGDESKCRREGRGLPCRTNQSLLVSESRSAPRPTGCSPRLLIAPWWWEDAACVPEPRQPETPPACSRVTAVARGSCWLGPLAGRATAAGFGGCVRVLSCGSGPTRD